jgi:glycosyltransferase involved in cell wall biosynthesis
VKVHLVDPELFQLVPSFAELADDFRADVVVGVSPTPSLQAIRSAGVRPVWIDLFGDLMAEGQAREIVHGDPAHLVASRDLLAELLARGDAFSAVSERQRLAVLGQLGLVGRLNASTADRQLVATMPLAVGPTARRAPARIDGIADRDFVVLWSGGFNTWCDVPTLVGGVEAAMDRHPAIKFVCTGAAIVGHDEDTYHTFLELVSRSQHRDRFMLLGCLPADEAASVHQRADLAVLTERLIPERVLGSSGRMGYWIESGIPFACTPVSEPGEELIMAGGALGFEPGDVSGLSRRILESAGDPHLLRTVVRKARSFADQRWQPETAHRPLIEWLRDPTCARDRLRPNPIDLSRLVHADQELETTRAEIEQLQRAKHELNYIHRSWIWRAWAAGILLRRRILRLLTASPRTR